MARSINSVQLLGNLGADPDVHTFQSGDIAVNLRVATSESWRDRQTGETKEQTEWHSVSIIHQGFAKVAAKYLKSGSKVLLTGKLATEKWQDDDGKDRYTTKVVLIGNKADLIMLDGKGRDEQPEPDNNEGQEEEIPL